MTKRMTLFLNVVTTFFLIGSIWIIQMIHFPLFNFLDKAQFSLYINKQFQLSAIILAGPIVIEMITTILMFRKPPQNTPKILSQAM